MKRANCNIGHLDSALPTCTVSSIRVRLPWWSFREKREHIRCVSLRRNCGWRICYPKTSSKIPRVQVIPTTLRGFWDDVVIVIVVIMISSSSILESVTGPTLQRTHFHDRQTMMQQHQGPKSLCYNEHHLIYLSLKFRDHWVQGFTP